MTSRKRIFCQAVTTSLSIIALTSPARADATLAPSGEELISDAFLNYFAFGLLSFVVVVPFCEIIAIGDIPTQISHSANHAREAAGCMSDEHGRRR